MQRPALPVLALSLAALLAGCANHLPQRSEHEQRSERSVQSHQLVIEGGEPAVLDSPERRLRFRELQSVEVKDFAITRVYDRYTPYQAWRELYEVPLGGVAVLAGVGANLLNVILLGNLPTLATHDWIDYGFAGLNPFMNTESNGRAEQNLALIKEEQLGTRIEQINLPWAERQLLATTGKQSFELETDPQGYLLLNLLNEPFADLDLAASRQLQLSTSDPLDNTQANLTLRLSKHLRSTLHEAHPLIYEDLEDDEVGQWVQRIKRLSELGLDHEARELEQSLLELTRNDPQLQQEFIQLLQQKTGRDLRPSP